MAIRNGDRIGPFTIEKPLSNNGGMSLVYIAFDTERPRHKAAVKLHLTDSRHAGIMQDALRIETNTLSQLHHPNIIHVYPLHIGRRPVYNARAVEHPDQPWYYAMEYLSGGSLDDISSKLPKYPFEWTIELFYQIVITIDYLHRAGFAHCDLKPQNIMFRQTPQPPFHPHPILIDFGGVSPVHQLREPMGTPRYAPPEVIWAMDRPDVMPLSQVRADKVDIWSLGTMFFEMLTGKPLFDQRNHDAIKTTVIRGELRKIREIRRDLHDSLDLLLAQMLQRNPAMRPSTTTIIDALEQHIYVTRPPRVAQ